MKCLFVGRVARAIALRSTQLSSDVELKDGNKSCFMVEGIHPRIFCKFLLSSGAFFLHYLAIVSSDEQVEQLRQDLLQISVSSYDLWVENVIVKAETIIQRFLAESQWSRGDELRVVWEGNRTLQYPTANVYQRRYK